MVDSISHRGPDDRGTYVSPDARIGLGSRRLSIIDLSPAGHMPLSNEDGSIHVAFNGEIYNFQELRDLMLRAGHVFRSRTDTEVLVHLYEERGESFLDLLDGMFAIALWDGRHDTLLLARDRGGEKPLYLAQAASSVRFASEIKAILVDDAIRREIDVDALNRYLTFGFVPPPATMFRDVQKIAPGEVIIINRHGKIDRRNYCSLSPTEDDVLNNRSTTIDTHIRQTRRMLEEAVESCMISDVPVGAFLSGGVDSSAVVALMSRQMGRPVETVTIRYPGHAASDESRFALLVAGHIGARSNLVDITEETAFEVFNECVYHLDEPIADPAAINTFIGSRALRSMNIPVALVGEGADELFLGYPYYLHHSRIVRLWHLRDRLPRPLVAAACQLGATALGPLGRSVHKDLFRRAAAGEGFFISSEPFFQDSDKRDIVGTRMISRVHGQPSAETTQRALSEATCLHGDVLAQMSLAEVRMRMAEKLLMRVDKLSMANSIETRAPFLNRHLVRYALAIPGPMRAAHGKPKWLLKTALADLLPSETLNRPKMGFGTPAAEWFQNSFGDLLEERVRSSDLVREGLLSQSAILDLLQAHRNGAGCHHTRLWNLLCLFEWAERFKVTGAVSADGLSLAGGVCV
jgi:asparagine synthase (glutamine-hydrolysing)